MLTYADIEGLVEEFVKVKSRQFSFGFYEPADIAQEIRTIAFKVLPKFNEAQFGTEKLKNFLGTCIDNGLRNLKRDNYVRTASPYRKQFELLDALDDSPEAQHIRSTWLEFQRRIKVRLGIVHAEQLSVIGDSIDACSFDAKMEYNDLERFLVENAPEGIVENLLIMLEGGAKAVPAKERRKVRQYVTNTLEELRD
jgi:hypothetical protein